jgi:endonuclease/exonuclease/phosphatase (EEP) superfamily protein YafD
VEPVRRHRGGLARGAVSIGASLAVLSVLSLFGSRFWLFDLIANYRPQLSALLVLLGAGTLLSRLPWHGSPTLALGIAGLLTLTPFFFGSPRPIGPNSATIEILTFNAEISNPDRAAVAEFIADEDPDLVFIFESSFEWEDTIRQSGLPLQIISVVPRGRLAGVTVLARPSLNPGLVPVDLTGEVSAVAVDLGDERIEVLGIHPVSPTSPGRSAARDRLIARAADWVATRDGEVVVVGDLNATPWSHAYSSLLLRGGLVDTLRGQGLQPTWPSGWGPLMIPIDHVLHTPGLGSADRRVGPELGSSHRPVLVDIGWAG